MASTRPTSTNIQPPAPEKDQPAPTISLSDAPKIALPKNLAQTLQFLSDVDLETLQVSVDSELKRRRPTSADPNARKASAAQLSCPVWTFDRKSGSATVAVIMFRPRLNLQAADPSNTGEITLR
jgi:hypothetical protein